MSIIDDSGTLPTISGGKQRSGTCNNCGMCCIGCPHLVLRAVIRINAGTTISLGSTVLGSCDIYTVRKTPQGIDYQNKGCATFPPAPQSQPYGCSFTWIPAPVELP